MAETEKDPIEQAVELLLYAPVGLLYEYQNVLPQLVKRGKSQVQLARVIGKMAVDRQTSGADESFERVVGGLLDATAQVLTGVGEAIGLAPPSDDTDRVDDGASTATAPPSKADASLSAQPSSARAAKQKTEAPQRLPIARYEDLKAKEIIPLLEDLNSDQLSRIAVYEKENRARKTVLAKIERLKG